MDKLKIMEYLLILAGLFVYVEPSHACDPFFRIEPLNVSKGASTMLQCDTSSCNGLTYSTIDKRISDDFEVAMRFNDGSVKGFVLSNNVSYEVSERINGLPLAGLSSLVINRSVLEDNGHWQCRVFFKNKEYTSDSLKLEVNSNKEDVTVLIYPPDFILLGTAHNYTCASYKVYPELDVLWNKNGANLTDAGINENRPNRDVFDIINIFQDTLYKREEYDIMCIMGTSTWSDEAYAPVRDIFVPTGLEKEYVSEKQPTPQDNLTMSCTVSGTSPTVAWLHNDTEVATTMFARTDHSITDGNFSYSEPTALRSTLVWILPDESKWCQELDEYSGVYQCTGNSAKGPAVASNKTDVKVQYKPILPNNEVTLNAIALEEVELACDVDCARPTTLTYHWSSDNSRPGLEQNQPSIWINVTKDDFSDTFFCQVSNDEGSSLMKFSIVETTVPPPTTTPDVQTTTFTETTTDGNVTTPRPDQTALIIANAVIWSLCGVVAIVLVCLALYHYRQIQNGKKYQEDNSEEIVLTDDEEKPGTSHRFGSDDYADVSNSVIGKGAANGPVGGIAKEGLYDEIQTSAQTQMPVAPKRASKINESHSQPRTPKTTRTHATNAPKSPLNAQHQPNSPLADRRLEPKADYSPVSSSKDISPKHSKESNHGKASKDVQQQKRVETSHKQAAMKQTINGAKPSVPDKPNITSLRSSRGSGINPAGAPYDNAEVNMYANCDQRPLPKNGDGTITYADLALQQEDPYDEGAPPVPTKNMNDQEPIQYASIKHKK